MKKLFDNDNLMWVVRLVVISFCLFGWIALDINYFFLDKEVNRFILSCAFLTAPLMFLQAFINVIHEQIKSKRKGS